MSEFFNDVDDIKAKHAVELLTRFAKYARAYPQANFAGLVRYCQTFEKLASNLVANGSLSPKCRSSFAGSLLLR